MRTLVLTCPELDGGERQAQFPRDRFPDVHFERGMSRLAVSDSRCLGENSFDHGFGVGDWDPAAMAVAYGHLAMWERVVELDQTCLLLEDDAVPLAKAEFDYFELDSFVEQARFPDNSILTLWRSGISSCARHDDRFVELTPSFGNWGTVAYVLSQDVARILVEGFPDMNCSVDHFVLGMGFIEPQRYGVFAPNRDLIGHPEGSSLRAD
jgi:hypothetical protein